MNLQTRVFRGLSALVLALNLANPAAGLEPGQGFDAGLGTTVDTARLDLSRPTDAVTLYSRIRSAAYSVCRAEKARWDAKAVLHQKFCIADAVEAAVVKANQPLLTAVHRASGERVAER